MTGWEALEAELAAWRAAGRQATLWWRDDDAVRPGPALDRLLALARDNHAPLALAVIPAAAEAALAQRLEEEPDVAVLQHGFAHRNHEPAERKKCELGAARPAAAALAELAEGRDRLAELFGPRFLPVLVPPWNRIDPGLIAALPGLGFRGLSTYGTRAGTWAAEGLLQVNSHADPIRWKPERGFLGEAATLALLCGHLRARRLGKAAAEEPTGLLTHHAAHDDALWGFLERLLAVLRAAESARILTVPAVFNCDQEVDGDLPLSA